MSLVYNPGLLDVDVLVRRFVARGELLAEVVADLAHPRPAHRLFVGQRGMGKTTLLRRIAAEIAREPALAARWLALTFPEEQYNVVGLSDFWLNCLDAAADALQAQGAAEVVEAIDRFVASLPDDEDERARRALDRLLAVAGPGRGLVLCVDNLQQVLGRLDEREQWALRRVLSERADLVLLAAAPTPPEDTQDYRAAFYDFLHLTRLDGLDFPATLSMLGALGDQAGRPELRERLAERPGRVHALHTLTGGNPRAVVMLFEVLLADPGEDIRPLVEALVDRATPLYKARFEELAEQAQVVFGALALEWHPATAATLAAATRLDVGTVSTQLTRLHRDGLVLKVDIAGEARVGYLVAERFFNLWYLMRASRRLRGRVLGFARCLEALYDAGDLVGLAERLVTRSEDTELLGALSMAVSDQSLRRALWSRVPPAELSEMVHEPEAVAYGDRVAANRRHFEARAKQVAAFDFEGRGVPRDIGEGTAAVMEPKDLEDGGSERYWREARGWSDLARLFPSLPVDELIRAMRRGLLQPRTSTGADPVDVAAAARVLGLPTLVSAWEVLTGWNNDQGQGRLIPVAVLLATAANLAADGVVHVPEGPEALLAAALNALPSEDPPVALLLVPDAIRLGRDDLAIQLANVATAHHFRLPPEAGIPTPAMEIRRSFSDAVARALVAAMSPTAPAERLVALHSDHPDPVVQFLSGFHLGRVLVEAENGPALSLLADRVRDGLPFLALALDVARTRDPGLLTRYAPEVREGAARALDQLWPAWRAAAAPTATRRQRRR